MPSWPSVYIHRSRPRAMGQRCSRAIDVHRLESREPAGVRVGGASVSLLMPARKELDIRRATAGSEGPKISRGASRPSRRIRRAVQASHRGAPSAPAGSPACTKVFEGAPVVRVDLHLNVFRLCGMNNSKSPPTELDGSATRGLGCRDAAKIDKTRLARSAIHVPTSSRSIDTQLLNSIVSQELSNRADQWKSFPAVPRQRSDFAPSCETAVTG
jgi:hypothetical protein